MIFFRKNRQIGNDFIPVNRCKTEHTFLAGQFVITIGIDATVVQTFVQQSVRGADIIPQPEFQPGIMCGIGNEFQSIGEFFQIHRTVIFCEPAIIDHKSIEFQFSGFPDQFQQQRLIDLVIKCDPCAEHDPVIRG